MARHHVLIRCAGVRRVDPDEIQAIADSLAPRVAEILARKLESRPELALSIPEAAAIAKVDERTIRDACEAGRLRHLKIGRQIRIPRSELFGL